MLQRNGFFSKDDQRGEMPEEWAANKTVGDAVMLCQVYANVPEEGLVARNTFGTKMKTFTDGVDVIKLNLDFSQGQEQAKDNMRQYTYLMGQYGHKQKELAEKYEKVDPKPIKDAPGYAHVYVPRKPMPFKRVYPAIGPEPVIHQFSNFALHHNISFEQLKLFWNFANAYSKKTSDRKPQIEMMINLFGISKTKATDWATSFYTDISPGIDAITTLFDRVTWRGWNLVEGPASDSRHDDPGVRFDDFNVAAMPENRRARMNAITTLNGVVNRIANQMNADGLVSEEVTIDLEKAKFVPKYTGLVEDMRAAMAGINPFQNEGFIAFNPQLWIYLARGRDYRFEIRRP